MGLAQTAAPARRAAVAIKPRYRRSSLAAKKYRLASSSQTYFRASGCRISINSWCARLVGSRNSSIECASINRLSRSSSRIRWRRLSCSSDGREVKNSRRSSPMSLRTADVERQLCGQNPTDLPLVAERPESAQSRHRQAYRLLAGFAPQRTFASVSCAHQPHPFMNAGRPRSMCC
jgi:hypothetical protein